MWHAIICSHHLGTALNTWIPLFIFSSCRQYTEHECFFRCCSSRPRQAVSCCWWDRWLTASPPSSLGSSLRNYPGYSFAGTNKHRVGDVKKSKAIKEAHSLWICRRKNDSSLPSYAAFAHSALHSHGSKIFVTQCCQLSNCGWDRIHGIIVAFSLPACVQLSLSRMANIEYIQNK